MRDLRPGESPDRDTPICADCHRAFEDLDREAVTLRVSYSLARVPVCTSCLFVRGGPHATVRHLTELWSTKIRGIESRLGTGNFPQRT